MLRSSINSDTRPIPAGAPVCGKASRMQLDRVVMAGGSLLAAGVVKSGAVVGGVINFYTNGVVDVDDWTLVTGTKRLTVGSLYRINGTAGKLTTSGSGQSVGLAVSGTQLTIQPSEPAAVQVDYGPAIADLQRQIDEMRGDVENLPSNQYAGEFALSTGVDTGTVNNFSLPSAPRHVHLSVSIPADGERVFAQWIKGTETFNSFEYLLSALPVNDNYVLHYLLFY